MSEKIQKNDHNLTNLSDRLKYVLSLLKKSQAELAREISVKPQTIQYLCNQKAEWSKFTFDIAQALGISAKWLATGEGDIFPDKNIRSQIVAEHSDIPILSHEQLKALIPLKQVDNIDRGVVKEWVLSSAVPQNKGFAIRLTDKSMWPRFDTYTVLVFDIDKKTHDGCYVLAYLHDVNEIVFREYRDNSGLPLLIPFNKSMFKEFPITQNDQILGVMVEAKWRESE